MKLKGEKQSKFNHFVPFYQYHLDMFLYHADIINVRKHQYQLFACYFEAGLVDQIMEWYYFQE